MSGYDFGMEMPSQGKKEPKQKICKERNRKPFAIQIERFANEETT